MRDIARIVVAVTCCAGILGAASAARPADTAFSYEVMPPKDAKLGGLAQLFECKPSNTAGCRYARLARLMSESYNFPRPLAVGAMECGTPNAFYSPDQHAVVLCYEMPGLLAHLFKKAGKTDSQAQELALNALVFAFIHELGHYAVGELGLGVMGKEEDAVDQFATLFLLGAGQPDWAVDGATAFMHIGNLQAAGQTVDQLSFYDEHSFGQQRFYDVVCSVYGSDPTRFSILVPGQLPRERAVRCVDEHRKHAKAWQTALAPYARKGSLGLAQKLAQVFVLVEGAGGKPIPGAYLTVFKPGTRSQPGKIEGDDVLFLGKTDAQGQYDAGMIVGAAAGDYQAKVVREGFRSFNGTVRLVEAAPNVLLLKTQLNPE